MQAPRSATEQYRVQQARAAATEAEVLRLWRSMGDNFDASWRRIAVQLAQLVAIAQLDAARSAADYLPAVLDETGQRADRYEIVPEAYAGTASDGRPLDSLLYQSVVKSGQAYNAGAGVAEALQVGGQFLSLVTVAQVQDAGRVATGAGTAANRFTDGYVRFLNPPSCQRCAVLAGRVYRYSTGFLRHPRCDCIMVPSKNAQWAEAEGLVWDPTENLDLIKDLRPAQRAAIEAGADINQVVNATRGMSVAGLETVKGTTARGVFGRAELGAGNDVVRGSARRQGAVQTFRQTSTATVRLTPERIYQLARTEEQATAMLERYGYITRSRVRSGDVIPTRGTPAGGGSFGGKPPSRPARAAAGDNPDEYPSTNTGVPVPWKPSERPRSSEATRRHVLDGDANGGGHRYGTGRAGKTEFPKSWSDDAIMEAVDEVLRTPDRVVHSGDKFQFYKQINGETVQVAVRADLTPPEIWTAYPLPHEE